MYLKTTVATAILAIGVTPGLAAEEIVEPASVSALQQMGKTLAALETFRLGADTSMEVVLDTEQKLTIGGTAMYDVRRPDGLRISLDTDVLQREFYFDGQQAIYVSPAEGHFAVVENPPATIAELLEVASQKYGLNFPAADLFIWGTDHEPVDQITEGFLIGPAMVNGHATNHWAYRTETQDWEVWIQAEGDPLPLRISYIDRTDPALPRFSATYSWDTGASIAAESFSYLPAPEMQQIEFAETDLTATSKDGGTQ